MTKENVPKIRFPGFNEPWEQRKFENEVVKKSVKKSSPDLIGIEYEDLEPETGQLLKSKAQLKKGKSGIEFKPGDILFGKLRPYLKHWYLTKENGIAIGDFWVLSPNNLPADFLYYFIQTNSFMDIANQSAGSKMPRSDWNQVSQTYFFFPRSLEESNKITKIFQYLDKLITLHQRELDDLKELKKGLLQKMFPLEGNDIPEVRFPGFTEPWEQRKLGELMNVTSVKRIHQSDWRSEGIPFLRARDIVAKFNGGSASDPIFISPSKYDEYSKLSGRVQVGDLLVTGVGTIGIPLLINDLKPIYFKDGNIIWFQNRGILDNSFFYYSFLGDRIQSFIKDSAGIGTVGTYTIESGKKTPIIFPNMEEQNLIGTLFKTLDKYITLHQRELDDLKELKKGLLQQMFV